MELFRNRGSQYIPELREGNLQYLEIRARCRQRRRKSKTVREMSEKAKELEVTAMVLFANQPPNWHIKNQQALPRLPSAGLFTPCGQRVAESEREKKKKIDKTKQNQNQNIYKLNNTWNLLLFSVSRRGHSWLVPRPSERVGDLEQTLFRGSLDLTCFQVEGPLSCVKTMAGADLLGGSTVLPSPSRSGQSLLSLHNGPTCPTFDTRPRLRTNVSPFPAFFSPTDLKYHCRGRVRSSSSECACSSPGNVM